MTKRRAAKTGSPLPARLQAELREAIAKGYKYLKLKPGSPSKEMQHAMAAAIQELTSSALQTEPREETGKNELQFLPEGSQRAFEKYAKASRVDIKKLTAGMGLSFMCAFYDHYRGEGVRVDAEGDMLLYEWGETCDSRFQIAITRQFMKEPAEDDNISQLSLTFRFAPSSETASLGSGNRWCHSPTELQGFHNFILCSAPCRVLGKQVPEEIELRYVDGV